MDGTLKYGLLFWVGLSFALLSQSKDVKVKVLKEPNCSLGDLDLAKPTSCEGVQDGGLTVRHQGYCLVNRNEDLSTDNDRPEIWTCDHGHWSGTDSSVGGLLHRQKRFFGIIAGAIIGCILFCGGGGGGGGGGGEGGGEGGGGTTVITKYPPSFEDPCKPEDVQANYNAHSGDSGAVVSWTEPVPTDRDGGTPSVTQVAGVANGGLFEGATYKKTHYITYKATDSDGLTGHCHFSFTVTILSCDILPWPDHGARTCENSNILGGSCYYTCDPGYQLSGSSTVTCENVLSPTWSKIPTCERSRCSSPSHPKNSSVHCSDPAYPYQSICTIHCDHGFSLDGPVYIQCQADGIWSNGGLSNCIDNSPPRITCLTPQIFYADRALTTTSVTWTEPTALDNTDPHPTIVKTDGPSMGAVLEVGSEIVQYKAIDSEGNESPKCFIELRVEEITCGHPMDSFNDTFLVFICTKPRYTYGTFCTLSCLAHLPLEGTDQITCEDDGNSKGAWNWGTGIQPKCKEISCPELDPPINGALVYDTIQTRPVYTMICNNNSDIPDMGSNFNGMFFCTDKAGWSPFKTVPDCIEDKDPRLLNLPAEIFYYSGDCGTEETMAQIEQNFQIILDDYLNPYFDSICPANETCRAENIVINCGPIQKRKKRSLSWGYLVDDFRRRNFFGGKRRDHNIQKRQTKTHLLILEFYIVVVLKLNNTTLRNAMLRYDDIQLNLLKPAVQEMVNNGTFDLDGFVLESESFQTPDYGDFKCDAGYELDSSKCKPCPVGYNWNNTKCEQCPMGQYKDTESEISCSSCPVGFSTKKTGSKSLNDCIKLCIPGSYSPDTMESCSPCLRGYYQDEYGQTSCNVCPAGTTTESTNSSSVTVCRSFDIFLEDTHGVVTVSTIPAAMNSMTFMFWAKRFDDQQSDAVLKLRNNGEDIISVYLTVNIRVEIPSQINETVGLHSSTSWRHVAITWDTTNRRVTVYVGGESVYIKEGVIAPAVPLINNGTFVVTSRGQTGLYLTGLHLLAKVLPDIDIKKLSASCYSTESDDVINMGAFYERQGISIIASSTCDAMDECLSSPCNGHLCTNGHGNFTCSCLGGWSGTTCTIPPDFCIRNACENGATCLSGNTSYTCNCSPGFSGNFCEIPPVDGGWSEWVSWTECSQSCGSGTQTRTRNCDSPSPEKYGKDCVGNSTEMKSCNMEDCPVCDELERKFGTLLNCTSNSVSASMTCVLYCQKDRFLPPGLRELQTYTCGPQTNYAWDSLGNLPSCVGPVGPRNASIRVTLNYTSVISDSSKQTVVDAVSDKLEATPCHNDSYCQTKVDITEFNDNSVSTIYVTLRIPLLLGPDIQYDAFISKGIVSDALQELNDAILILEASAKYLENYTTEVYDVTTNGVSVTADSSSLAFQAVVKCDSGYAVQDGFCLRCPSGTYSDNGICSFCAKGTYQENTGQTSCSMCASGLTTSTIGSSDRSQCTVRCPAGTYSDNGVCSFCEKGTYQENTGQASCSRCPPSLTTSTLGSSNRSQCTEEEAKTSSSSTVAMTTTTIQGPVENKSMVYIAVTIAAIALIVAVVAICAIIKFKINRPKPDTLPIGTERKSGKTIVYRSSSKANLTSSPIEPHKSTTDCTVGSDSVDSVCIQLSATMSSGESSYLTVISGNCQQGPYSSLPHREFTETDEHVYNTIC